MPEGIRRTGTGLAAYLRQNALRTAAIACTPSLLPHAARAEAIEPNALSASAMALGAFEHHEIATLALTLGIMLFAVVTAIMLVRTRARAATAEASARGEIIALRAEADRLNTLLLAEPQVVVAWAAADDEPDIRGDATFLAAPA